MGETQRKRLLRDRRQAWWTSVLTGPGDVAYPVLGARIAARLDGDTLTVSGTVATEQDRQDIRTDSARLIGQGISDIRLEIELAPPTDEEPGLLVQTLVGIFESTSQATFAASYLESQGQIDPIVLRVFSFETDDTSEDDLRRLLGEPYWDDVVAAHAANRAILVLTVDETVAFQAREILEEETRSLKTIVLPPVPAAAAPTLQLTLADGADAPDPIGSQGLKLRQRAS